MDRTYIKFKAFFDEMRTDLGEIAPGAQMAGVFINSGIGADEKVEINLMAWGTEDAVEQVLYQAMQNNKMFSDVVVRAAQRVAVKAYIKEQGN